MDILCKLRVLPISEKKLLTHCHTVMMDNIKPLPHYGDSSALLSFILACVSNGRAYTSP